MEFTSSTFFAGTPGISMHQVCRCGCLLSSDALKVSNHRGRVSNPRLVGWLFLTGTDSLLTFDHRLVDCCLGFETTVTGSLRRSHTRSLDIESGDSRGRGYFRRCDQRFEAALVSAYCLDQSVAGTTSCCRHPRRIGDDSS
jgi:hypothetical protein